MVFYMSHGHDSLSGCSIGILHRVLIQGLLLGGMLRVFILAHIKRVLFWPLLKSEFLLSCMGVRVLIWLVVSTIFLGY